MRSSLIALTVVSTMLGCGDGASYIVVSVTSSRPLSLKSLEMDVTNAAATVHVSVAPGKSFSIPPEQSFNLAFDASRRGDVRLDLKAVAIEGVVAERSMTTTLIPGDIAHAQFDLTAAGGPDLGTSGDAAPPDLTMLSPPALTSVTPAKGPTVGGTTLTLSGSELHEGCAVAVAGTAAQDVKRVSSTQVSFKLPAKPGALGAVSIVLTNPDGQTATLPQAFSYYPGILGFLAPTSYKGGSAVADIASADFDQDGNPDLVVSNLNENSIGVFLGDGRGTFQPMQTYSTGKRPQSLAVADFNGDRWPDVAVADADSLEVGVFLGGMGGRLSPGVRVALAGSPFGMDAVDVNGDGKFDIVAVPGKTGDLSVALGNGDGTFGTVKEFGPGKRGAQLAAMNGLKGFEGIVFTSVPDQGVYFEAAVGDGTFRAPVFQSVGSQPWGVLAHDFDSDGKLDIAFSDLGEGAVKVLLRDWNGSYKPARSYPTSMGANFVRVGDFDLDGVDDLVVSNGSILLFGPDPSDNVSVLLGNGDGTFSPAQNFTIGPMAQAFDIVVADFNKDGKPDVAAANPAGDIRVLINSSQ